MTYPGDTAMLFLTAVFCGDPVDPSADATRLVIGVRDGDGVVQVAVDPIVLAELEDRRWLLVTEAGLQITHAGQYWLKRWFQSKRRKR